MKKVLKIVGKVVLALLVVVYIAVALLNLSIVQSYLGAAASRHFSQEWGGTVHIGSLHVTPLGHVKLRDILLVSPDNDTIFQGESLYCHFDHFPLSDEGLSFSRVCIRNAYYHLGFNSKGINLRYIFDYYARPDKPEDTLPSPLFVVRVNRLILDNIHYKQDLRKQSEYYAHNDHGVNISHMDFTRIDGNFKNVYVDDEVHVNCRIVHLACEERSGFHMHDMSADVKVSEQTIQTHDMELTTDNTHMRCDVTMNYDSWDSFSGDNFFDSVFFDVQFFDGTTIGLRDAAFWAPSLWGIDDEIALEADVEGPLGRMTIDKLALAFGQHTHLVLNGDVVGLPDVARTEFNLDIQPACVCIADLVALHQPQHPLFRIPKVVEPMGLVKMQAILRGSLKKGAMQLAATSDAGPLTAEATVEYPDKPSNLRYNALLQSDHLNVALLTGDKRLSSTTMQATLRGSGIQLDQMVAEGDIELRDAVVDHRTLAPLHTQMRIDRKRFTLHGDIDDALASLQVDGEGLLSGDSTSYNLHLNLRHCQLSQWLTLPDTTLDLVLSALVDMDMQGLNLDQMRGRLDLHGTHIVLNGKRHDIDDIAVTLDEDHLYKRLHLQSLIAQADLSGYYKYRNLPQIGQILLQRYLPTDLAPTPLTAADSATLATTAFDAHIVWNDPHRLLNLWKPNLHLAPGTQLHGNYNHTEALKLVARSDSIRIGSLRMLDLALSSHPVGESYGTSCDINLVDMGGLPLFTDLRIYSSINAETSRLRLNWDDDPTTIRDQGNIGLLVQHDSSGLHRLQVTDPTFYLRGKRWDIDCDDITLASQTFLMPHLSIRSDNGAISATATATPDGDVSATAQFEHFSIDLIDSLLLADKHITVEGTVDGQVHAQRTQRSATPYLLADLSIDSCSVNDQFLGTVSINSSLDLDRQWLDLNAQSTLQSAAGSQQPIAANGHITLDDKPQIDLSIHLDNFALATVAPLLRSFASSVGGTVSSDMQVVGPLDRPQVEGMAHIHNGLLEVDYTGVTYHCNDSVTFSNARAFVNNCHIYDPDGNLLIANGGIDYSDPDNMRIDLNVHSDRITVLNTKAHGDNPYGTLMAALDGTITGRGSDITIDAAAQTLPGCNFTIPVDNKLSSSEQDYIHFVTPRTVNQVTEVAPLTASNRPDIRLALTITPDLRLHVPMEFYQLSVNIQAVGAGNLQLHTGSEIKTSLIGNYELSSGTLGLTMLSLVGKNFNIEPGSSLLFPGDINNVQFDVSAVYALRASMTSLTGNETENGQRNIPVESIINLAGTLQDPVIRFDLRLPNVDATTSEEVFAYIDRSNQRDMLNQTVSLLAMGQFYNSSGSNQTTSTTSGYGVMAKSVGAFVSQLVTVVDIDFGYTAATDLATEKFDIDIKKSWDRFYFESTLGYGGESRRLNENADVHAVNNLVGDILVGYRLNPRLHLFVFNRTNTNDYTRMELPYKQGFGLKYTRDFNRWGDLFRKASTQP